MSGWIQTYTGRALYPLDPKPSQFSIKDIARGLAMRCRYSGQCSRFYSVAEHSVLMARHLATYRTDERWAENRDPLGEYTLQEVHDSAALALLHDASEAFLADVPRPLKPLLVGYQEAEDRMTSVIVAKYLGDEGPAIHHEIVKVADYAILLNEKHQLMAGEPKPWGLTGHPLFKSSWAPKCWTPEEAEREYLTAALELLPL